MQEKINQGRKLLMFKEFFFNAKVNSLVALGVNGISILKCVISLFSSLSFMKLNVEKQFSFQHRL
jgi:hypothetical protein